MFIGITTAITSSLWFNVLTRPLRVGAFRLDDDTYGYLDNDFLG